jgi:hypothetical protein
MSPGNLNTIWPFSAPRLTFDSRMSFENLWAYRLNHFGRSRRKDNKYHSTEVANTGH